METGKVLPRLYAPVERDYDEAVRDVILGLGRMGFKHKEIAQRIGVTPKTVGNAQEMKHSLAGWCVARIEYEFGPEAVKPIIALGGGGRAAPIDPLGDSIREHVKALGEALAADDAARLERARG